MEHRTEFDLTKQIAAWKSALAGNASMTRDNVDELESHLRDEIDDLQKLGLNEEESFLIAKKRIGGVEELTSEFGKVNRGVSIRNKMIPYLTGVLLFMAVTGLTHLIVNFSVIVALKVGVKGSMLNVVSVGALVFISILFFAWTYWRYKQPKLMWSKLTRIPVLVGVVLVSRILAYLTIPILTHIIPMTAFGSVQMNISIYQIVFGLFILSVSSIVFYQSRRAEKVALVN